MPFKYDKRKNIFSRLFIPPEVAELWKLEQNKKEIAEKLDIKPKVIKITLNKLDEIEIVTPEDYYVFGVSENGKLIMGDTPKTEQLAVIRFYGDNSLKIPTRILRKFGVEHNKLIQIIAFGEDELVLRAFEFTENQHYLYQCDNCKRKLNNLPTYFKPTFYKHSNKIYFFCTIKCKREYKRKLRTKENYYFNEKVRKGFIKYGEKPL